MRDFSRRDVLKWSAASLLGAPLLNGCAGRRPLNVLFITIDDLNNWVGCLGGHPQARTPNIDRLADRGTLFSRAYCPAPICYPSRTSVLTGLMPTRTGIFTNKSPLLREMLPDVVTLPQHFMANGYRVLAGGKVFHAPDDASWHQRFQPVPEDAYAARTDDRFGWKEWSMTNFGPLRISDNKMWDGQLVRWAIRQLQKKHTSPFFLAPGFFQPHLPNFVPRKYFRPFPFEKVTMPRVFNRDLNDVPRFAKNRRMGRLYGHIVGGGQWRQAVASYLAAIHFVDAMVGRLLDALDESPYADSTAVVLSSDHGFMLGEKRHWGKYLLWEQATQVPFIISVPGVTKPGGRCEQPVTTIHIYPTLAELCGLPAREGLDGRSLVPLLRDPGATWELPAVTTTDGPSHAVRTERWRYIRYADGTEELYDHDEDPLEWRNLAGRPEHAQLKEELARWMA